MDSIIVFNKSMNERLEEYRSVLCNGEPPLPANKVALHWSYHLELIIETVGWQALWKIPRRTCQAFDIKFPTVVLVEVNDVDVKELTAFISIIGVKDIINVPTKHEVLLKDLFPTQHQENPVDAKETANILDQLRFFYNHLWRPWDCEESENEDWPSTYLEARLQLRYDIQNGRLSRQTAEKVSRLLAEGRQIYAEKEELESRLDDEAADKDDIVYALTQLHIRLAPIKTELSVLENASIRTIVEKKISTNDQKREAKKYIVWEDHPLEEYIEFLREVEKICGPMTRVTAIHSLQAGLEVAQAGDNFLLAPGSYDVTNSGRLEEGGLLLGIGKDYCACLRSRTPGNFLLDVCSGTLTLQNLQLDGEGMDMACIVRSRGTLELKNVLLQGTENCMGIVVMPGGKLVVRSCVVKGCQVAVFCHPGSSVTLVGTQIVQCKVGLQMRACGGLQMELQSCKIQECEYGMDIVADVSSPVDGSVEILEKAPGVKHTDLKMLLNKTDVSINQQHDVLEVDLTKN